VFELLPNSDGSWTEKVLHKFKGKSDGSQPIANVIFDAAGNLYGTTAGGGDMRCSSGDWSGCGVVFKLTPTPTGGWTQHVLHQFTGGYDGVMPVWPNDEALMTARPAETEARPSVRYLRLRRSHLLRPPGGWSAEWPEIKLQLINVEKSR
jgi:hypothetical protein